MEIAPRISIDEDICFGKPRIKGTRINVDLIVGQLAGGLPVEKVMKEYGIKRKDVLAALRYAERVLSGESIRVITPNA